MRAVLERLLDKGVTIAEYHGGKKGRQQTSVQAVDFDSYLWSGIIIEDKAIFISKDWELDEATTQDMLDKWFGRK
jgi:hypothetical protein